VAQPACDFNLRDFAVLSVTAALILAWWIEARWQSVPHVSLFICAVMCSAWFGGIGPGLVASVLSVLAFDYYFLLPIYSLAVNPQELPLLLFWSFQRFLRDL
jgi:K+-sensing histidine kinase KdpD